MRLLAFYCPYYALKLWALTDFEVLVFERNLTGFRLISIRYVNNCV